MNMVEAKVSTARKNGVQDNPNEIKSSILHNAVLGEQPTSDAGYLELLGYSIFSIAAGDRKTIDENWPEILYGFKNFHVQRVAEFTDDDLRDVSQRVPLLRDKPQLPAMVVNAAAVLQISQVYGSFKKYLRSFEKDGPAELFKDISGRFKLVDRGIFQNFLKSAGAKTIFPESTQSKREGRPAKSSRRGGRQGNHRHPKAGGGQTTEGKAKPTRGGKRMSPKPARQENGQDSGKAKGNRPRKSRFSFRKKKAAGNSAQANRPATTAKE
jgi:3-methyladenine DNA glycosylase Tag